jgi:hypothetical protein
MGWDGMEAGVDGRDLFWASKWRRKGMEGKIVEGGEKRKIKRRERK